MRHRIDLRRSFGMKAWESMALCGVKFNHHRSKPMRCEKCEGIHHKAWQDAWQRIWCRQDKIKE